MKKLSLDVLGITALALVVALFVLVWGKEIGITTPEARSNWIAGIALCALAFAFLFAFDNRARIGSAARNLARWLHIRAPEMVGTTQGSLATSPSATKQTGTGLSALREYLRAENGVHWRYRQSWLLLTGNEATFTRALPDLAQNGWLVTQDAVLLWNKPQPDGRPDEGWLRELRSLRRSRPIDAVILTLGETVDALPQHQGIASHSVSLARIAAALRWSAPVYVLDIAKTDEWNDGRTALIGCDFAPDANARTIESTLLALRNRIGHASIEQLIRSVKDRYSAELSKRLDDRSALLAQLIAVLMNRKDRHQGVSGAFFAPFPRAYVSREAKAALVLPSIIDLPLWAHLATISRKAHGKRMGLHPVTVFSTVALTVIGIWTAGMLISGMTNARNLFNARATVQALDSSPDAATRLNALLALQQQIGGYEQRVAHQSPLWTRFGLNQDKAILSALWPSYSAAGKSVLVTPIQNSLEATLIDLSQMPTGSLDDHANSAALEGHKALKTYLMLANPSRVDTSFLTPQLVRYWTTSANVSAGAKLDLAEQLLGFYAQHLKAHDAWRIQPREELVNASRQTLLSVIGVRNSEDTVYQSVLAGVGNKYPDQTLASLTTGTDTHGLVRSNGTVPGVYTRQAYEGYVAAAITEAAKSRDVTRDWVLANNDSSASPVDSTQASSTNTLEAALTTQYFNDYAEHWQSFMNALQWQPAPNIPAAIEQMKLLADARQSPIIALMKSLDYQGNAGVHQASLSDTLVAKAQNMFGKKDDPQGAAIAKDAGPLSASFGPVLRLIGEVGEATAGKPSATSDVSLQRYLERVTALRLKLQQISNGTDADAQARQLAQALFQGKGSELADTQAYAQLVSASLGAQWSGMGDALFVRPVAQATQIVLQPAQASLNDAWRQTIVATWNKSFA
ncbi:hypothetical protein ASG35_11290, partial [Burkholderia sp. Leaf177]|uniref:ImcF-related family protein n=1 Tax=Burkholderia sp. Leaf177 TaxID=1736287 RepID=UPI0007001586